MMNNKHSVGEEEEENEGGIYNGLLMIECISAIGPNSWNMICKCW
jgi:hypothetical protein